MKRMILMVLLMVLALSGVSAQISMVEDVGYGWYVFAVDDTFGLGAPGTEQGTSIVGVPDDLNDWYTYIDFGVRMGLEGELRSMNISSPYGPVTGEMGIVRGTVLVFQGISAMDILGLPSAVNEIYGDDATVTYTAADANGVTRAVRVSGMKVQGAEHTTTILRTKYYE